jgi:hypothetical protein
MSLDSDVDPDIAAAFSNKSDTSAPTGAVDPDIADAFKDDTKKQPRRTLPANEAVSGPLGFINGLAETAGKSVANIPYAAAHGAVDLYRRATGGDTNAPDPALVRSLAFPLSNNARDAVSSLGSVVPDRLPGDPTSGDVNEAKTFGLTPFERGGTAVLGDVASMAPMAYATRGAGSFLSDAKTLAPKAAIDPQAIVDRAYAGQSMGAAAVAANVSALSPNLQQAISRSAQKTGGAVNMNALVAHIEADDHGIKLTKGQATRDPNQFSEEQNSTHPDIVKRLNEQNGQIVDAIDNVRRDASPTNVANSPRENGQVVLDDLKAYDEPIRADIKAKYQKLQDANGGAIPIDTGNVISNVDARLKKGFLTGTAADSKPIAEVMNSLRSGEPMDFESFEEARSRMAEIARGPDKSAAKAAGIVRDELEKMPLPDAAQPLKAMADDARSAAAKRFEEMRRDPAYETAVDDVNNGTPKGKRSDLADTFLDDYALSKSAPLTQVDRMISKLGNEGKGAIASHTLSAIRKGAVNASGNVVPNGYNTAMAKYADKLPSLVEPDTIDKLQSLGRTITRAKVAPPGNYVNYSKSGVIMNAAAGAAEHALNAKTGGVYGLGKKLLTGDKFAKEALAPGAGLDQLETKP